MKDLLCWTKGCYGEPFVTLVFDSRPHIIYGICHEHMMKQMFHEFKYIKGQLRWDDASVTWVTIN